MRIIHKDSRAIQKRAFVCRTCGAETPATKRKGKTKHGHIKTMWCYQCKGARKFIQSDYCEEIRTMEERIERLEELVDGMRGRIATLKDRVAALEREAQERQLRENEFRETVRGMPLYGCGSVSLTGDTSQNPQDN